MTNVEIKYYFQENKCYKFDGTWDEFQEYIHSHETPHSTLRIMDTIYFDCLGADAPNDSRITEII